MIGGILMAAAVAHERIEAVRTVEAGALSKFLYGICMAGYLMFPDLARWLPIAREREEMEASRLYAGGFSLVVGGLFLLLGMDRGANEGFYSLFVLLMFFIAVYWWVRPFLPKLLGPLHVTVDKRGVRAKTSYFFRSRVRQWTQIDRVEISEWAVHLVTKEGSVDKISLKRAANEESHKIISVLTEIATAKGIAVEA